MTPLPVMRSPVHKVGRGLKLRFTLVDGTLEVEWLGRMPGPADRKILPRYRAARNAFLGQVSARIGGGIAVVEQ